MSSNLRPRFSKQKVVDNLMNRIATLEEIHGFDPENGSAQVESSSQDRVIAYGKYAAYLDLCTNISEGYI